MKTINKLTNKSFVFASLLLGLCLMSFSCAPKKSSVRAQNKTTSTNLNPTTSAAAEQQASTANAIYKIQTVSLPEQTDSGYLINSELANPSNQYLPVTTRHENGVLDSEGVYNDTARGLQVYVNARCADAECYKYLLLITVVRNNNAIYQSGAISFKDDCKFYTVSNSSTAGQIFRTMNDFENQYSYVQPMNDASTCQ